MQVATILHFVLSLLHAQLISICRECRMRIEATIFPFVSAVSKVQDSTCPGYKKDGEAQQHVF